MVLCSSCDGIPLKFKKKRADLQFTSTDQMSLVSTPLRVRWTTHLTVGLILFLKGLKNPDRSYAKVPLRSCMTLLRSIADPDYFCSDPDPTVIKFKNSSYILAGHRASVLSWYFRTVCGRICQEFQEGVALRRRCRNNS
jgi:hypothetical protein